MSKRMFLAVLFFSGLWGLSEAALGGALYGAEVAHASVILTVIGLVVLTFANVYFPQKGVATAIAGCAMLYKFLNLPFYACHLPAIFLIGICYDLFLNGAKIKNRALSAVFVVYASYASFALIMTYIVRYGFWVEGDFGKVVSHIGVSGSMAALASAVVVPLSFRLAKRLKNKYPSPFDFQWRFLPGSVSFATVVLWIFGLVIYFF